MRDYKLRKKVFNDYLDTSKLPAKTDAMTSPVGVDADGNLWAEGTTVSGTKSISNNGTYDVSEYQYAEVNVPTGSTMQEMKIINSTGGSLNLVRITEMNKNYVENQQMVSSGSSLTTKCLYTQTSRTDAFVCAFFSTSALSASTSTAGLNLNMVSIGTNLYALFSNASVTTFFSGTPEITISKA